MTAARPPAPRPTHTYTTPGTYTAKLTATDPGGAERIRDGPDRRHRDPGRREPQTGERGRRRRQLAAPQQTPWFGVSKPAKTTVATFTKSGLSVQVTCTEAMTGTATLTLSAKLRKQLGLKSGTLAASAVKCAGAGSKTVSSSRPRPSSARSSRPRLGQGHARREPARRGPATKKATRAVTLSR